MRGILVGYDGSGHSVKALEWAAHEAALRHAELVVLHICQENPRAWGRAATSGDATSTGGTPADVALADVALAEARDRAEEEAGKALARAGAGLPRPRVTVRAIRGVPAEELLSAAADADMLVVGARGAGGFRKLLLGSVSSHLAHHSHCPVVVIPDDDT
jgi:nucleotide-binding universal stress UspA family protein